MKRRDFISFIPAGFALTFLSCKQNKEHTVPLTNSMDNLHVGEFNYYTSSFDNGLFRLPIVVKTFNGKPIQLTANEINRKSHGLTSEIQTSLLDLYDPKRMFKPRINNKTVDISELIQDLAFQITQDEYDDIWVLSGSLNDCKSTEIEDMSKNLNIRCVPVLSSHILNQIAVNEAMFNQTGYDVFDISKAELIITLDYDFLSDNNFGLIHQRQLNPFRENPNSKIITISESSDFIFDYADDRLILDISSEKFLLALYSKLFDKNQFEKVELHDEQEILLDEIAEQLLSNSGKVLVVSKPKCSKTERILTSLINYELKAYENIIRIQVIQNTILNDYSDFIISLKSNGKKLLIDFSDGLLEHNSEFGEAIQNAVNIDRFLFSSEDNQVTNAKAIIPVSHYLECWSSGQTLDNELTINQQIVQKINKKSTSMNELLFDLNRLIYPEFAALHKEYYSYFRSLFLDKYPTVQDWNKFLRDGFSEQNVMRINVELKSDFDIDAIEYHEVLSAIVPLVTDNVWLKEINYKLDQIPKKDFYEHFELITKQEFISSSQNKWAMLIDSNKCTGCGSCLTSCMIENNIPTTGKESIDANKDLHWISINRYELKDGSSRFIPIFCQHCDNAPCERVCPVGATFHSQDGINEMTYNRCIGTRYCMANCPYEVRKFNFKEHSDSFADGIENTLNPNVTVRSKGVSEKCTFCIQRIREAEIDAKLNGTIKIKDGTIKTACQESCPSGAITFGNIHDPNSTLRSKLKNKDLYQLKGHDNTKPSIYFTI